MILRLNQGEELSDVRAEFVRDFSSVPTEDIVEVEQELIREGMPVQKVQALCDVHSALFHGKTEREMLEREKKYQTDNRSESVRRVQELESTEGHLLNILHRENLMLEQQLKELDEALLKEADVAELHRRVAELRKVKPHYAKKEELILPLLETYGAEGPSKVMWGVDDEIRQELLKIQKLLENLLNPDDTSGIRMEDLLPRISAVSGRMREMIFKEENILFPLAVEKFTEEDWLRTYGDMAEIGYSWLDGKDVPVWKEGEQWRQAGKALERQQNRTKDGTVHFDSGDLTFAQIRAIFQTLPVDLTFIDEHDTLRFFTNAGKVFSRPHSALGREVYACHPARVQPIVRGMIQAFREGKQTRVDRWIPKPENPIRVSYLAVHDDSGQYAGTLEIVQQYGDAVKTLQALQKHQKG